MTLLMQLFIVGAALLSLGWLVRDWIAERNSYRADIARRKDYLTRKGQR